MLLGILLEPGSGQLAGIFESLGQAGAVVFAAANARTFGVGGFVAFGVAATNAAIAGVDGDEGGHF